jgi:hypothetical protein
VPQDSVTFSANALENIRYGKPDASDDEVVKAARLAAAHEFIEKLPEGYQSFLGERGVRLVRRPAPAHRDCPCAAEEPAACCYWTKRPARSTPNRNAWCKARWKRRWSRPHHA